jgi:transcriptional regulator with XRE-family HTH domain
MMRTAIAALALTAMPPAGYHGNPWVRAAEEDASLTIFPFGGNYSDHSIHWRSDRRYVLNLGKLERHLGDVFARGSSANFDVLASVQRHDPTMPQQVELVRELRQLSGLTWHHLADMVGVSAKTLHNWAAGKSIDEKNLRRVGEVISVLRFIDRGSADANRALLLNESVDGQAILDLVKAGEFAGVRQAIGRGQGRAVAAEPLPRSTLAAWGPEDLGEQLSKWQVEAVTEVEPSARPTRARPANARRKG